MKGSLGHDTGASMTALNKFISIHVHKCAGTTFGFLLQSIYGDKFFWDKSEDTVNSHGRTVRYREHEYMDKDVIHGHVHVNRYAHLNYPYITWLRHPIDRMESEYSIIRQKRLNKRSSPLHRKVIIEQMTFQQYCKEVHNVYSSYLGDKDINDFAFIGITEYFEQSLAVFAELVGKKIPPYYRRNSRIMKRQWFKEGTKREKSQCRNYNRKDITFYMRAKKRLANEFKSCISRYESGECSPQDKS